MTKNAVDCLDLLPHRPPFRFITGKIELDPGKTGNANWEVNGDEDFFAGHFPGEPMVPGVLIGEALAQLCGLVAIESDLEQTASLAASPSGSTGVGKLAHIDLRLHKTVTPPARIELSCRWDRVFGPLVQYSVLARVEGKKVASGSLSLALPQPSSQQGGGPP